MAETTADVRRDIELTRDRISNTLEQLEQKVNVGQIVKDNPWPAVGLAVGVGYLLSGSSVDVRASATTLAATKGASSKLGGVLDDLVANLMGGLSAAFEQRVEGLVTDLKTAIGAPAAGGASSAKGFSSAGSSSSAAAGGNMGHQMATSAGGSQATPGVSSSMSNAAAAAPGYETRAD
jgi:hypothetical protein